MSVAFSTLITRVNSIERGEKEACGSKIMRLGIVMTSFVSCYSCKRGEQKKTFISMSWCGEDLDAFCSFLFSVDDAGGVREEREDIKFD